MDQALTCTICFDIFLDPRYLPCKHIFCFKCLSKIENQGEIQCPLCNTKTHENATNLPKSFILRDAIQHQYKEESPPSPKPKASHSQKCIFCSQLTELYCSKCDAFICSFCKPQHQAFPVTATHPDPSPIHPAAPVPAAVSPQFFCPLHARESSLFCKDCNKVICHDCRAPFHASHAVAAAAQVAESRRKYLSTNFPLNSLSEQVDTLELNIQSLMATEKQVTEEIQKLQEIISEKQQQLSLSVAEREKMEAKKADLQKAFPYMKMSDWDILNQEKFREVVEHFSSRYDAVQTKNSKPTQPAAEKNSHSQSTVVPKPNPVPLARINSKRETEPTDTSPFKNLLNSVFSFSKSVMSGGNYPDRIVSKPSKRTINNGNHTLSSKKGSYSAAFLEDICLPDGSKLKPNEEFTKVWLIQNSGGLPWPVGTQLVQSSGDPIKCSLPHVPPANPGESVQVSIKGVAPDKPGNYVSHFRLCLPNDTPMGHRFWIDIHVV